MRIVVADDHQIVRRGLELIVSRRPGWTIAAEAENESQLFDALARGGHDVLVLDFALRARTALELLPRLRQMYPSLPILVLGSEGDAPNAVAVLRAGARGYVSKDATGEEFLEAMARVASGRTWITAETAELLAHELSSPVAPHARLSPRELDVFLRLARGESVSDIAAALGLSVKTVSTYRTRVLEKTGFRSNADIVAYAIRARLL